MTVPSPPGASGPYLVTVTAGSAQEAGSLAAMAVDRRLAACAQVGGPVSSTYRWQGTVERAEEWVCTLKTAAVTLGPLMAALRRAHSYDLPEIVAVPLAGDADYLRWVEDGCAAP